MSVCVIYSVVFKFNKKQIIKFKKKFKMQKCLNRKYSKLYKKKLIYKHDDFQF